MPGLADILAGRYGSGSRSFTIPTKEESERSAASVQQFIDYVRQNPSEAGLYGASMALPSPIGDIAGLAGDVTHYAKNPEDLTWGNAAMSAAGLLPFVPGGMAGMVRAYHGSPHSFDKFDISKIGTGEGAQAYGHGLYFTESPEIADHYRTALSPPIGGDPVVTMAAKIMDNGSDPVKNLKRIFPGISDEEIDAATKAAKAQPRGKVYTANLLPDDDEFLLWDKPLSEQPEKVRNALSDAKLTSWSPDRPDMRDPYSGQALYNMLSRNNLGGMNKADATERLRKLGIRGIKYLDGTSRAKGEGSYNYVIFDDKDVEIVK